MDIEEEIARTIDKAFDDWQGEESEAAFVTARLSPLLNRVRAEARAEAFREAREAINHTRNVPSLITLADKFGGYHQGQRSGLEMADGLIARIEQNSEGNET